MNKQIHVIAILAIMGMMSIGQQTAHATNESDYNIGYNNGVTQADNDWGHIELHICPDEHGHCPISYPPGHTPEYYAGYKTGYNDEISHDAEG
jgi:hypothetical protein